MSLNLLNQQQQKIVHRSTTVFENTCTVNTIMQQSSLNSSKAKLSQIIQTKPPKSGTANQLMNSHSNNEINANVVNPLRYLYFKIKLNFMWPNK